MPWLTCARSVLIVAFFLCLTHGADIVGSCLVQARARVTVSGLLPAGWEHVDNGVDVACRGDSPRDNSASYYTHVTTESLEDCTAQCSNSGVCTGVEYNAGTGRCELWKRDIGASIQLPGFQCLRLQASTTTAALPKGWEHVDAGVDVACRGDSPQDNSASYYTPVTASSLTDCAAQCSNSGACTGVEYNVGTGRCELWKRDIGASIQLSGFQCLRLQASTTTSALPKGWEHVDAGVDLACRGDSPQDNSASYYKLVTASSLKDCTNQCGICAGVEYNAATGRCELWKKHIGASIRVPGFQCLRPQFVATTGAGVEVCGGPDALNDFSSKTQMEQAGWVWDWSDGTDFKPGPGAVPAESYWGYAWPGDGTMSLTLQGSGSLTLDYGNSWGDGLVRVFLNGALKSTAHPSTLSKKAIIEFRNGDVLKISEAPTAVIVINRITFACPQTCSSNRDCPSYAPSCATGACQQCSTDADCPSAAEVCIRSKCKEPDPFRVVTSEHKMAKPFAKARPWTVMPGSGFAGGAQTFIPRRMYTTACGGNRLIVAWTAHAGWQPHPEFGPGGTRQDQGLWEEITVGHVSEFITDGMGKTSLVSDQELMHCNEVGNVAASATCDVVAMLCRSSKKPTELRAHDFQAETESKHGKQFGWYVPSQPNASMDKYRIVDHMYLLEWTSGQAGQTGQAPQSTVHLGKNIGGWNYGHWDISLNKNSSIYAVDLKTTIGPPREDEADFNWGWHEGSVNYAINREDWSWIRGFWGGAEGHTLENRLFYNQVSDTWARFYGSDAKDFWSRSIYFGTFPGTGRMKNIYHIPPSPTAGWHGTGGPFNMVSRGEKGWLGIMNAPDPRNPKGPTEEVDTLVAGLIEAPLDAAGCKDGACKPLWLSDLPKMPPNPEQKLGMLNLQSLGPSGADARLILGWARVRNSASSEYYLAEIGDKGRMKSKAQLLDGTGWGEDNAWATIPETGCVAWAFTWNEDLANPYGNSNFGGDLAPGTDAFSDILRITVVC